MVSTDSADIAKVAAEFGAEVPFRRPAELAGDDASTYDVIRHALDHYRQAGRTFDYTVLLEPTSPLREDSDIDAVLERLDAHGDRFDSIVTLGRVGEHPSIMKRLHALRVEPFAPELHAAARRQDQEPAYFPYGVCGQDERPAGGEHLLHAALHGLCAQALPELRDRRPVRFPVRGGRDET
jgi:CMP-N-acetylneuraminic acid synthetase